MVADNIDILDQVIGGAGKLDNNNDFLKHSDELVVEIHNEPSVQKVNSYKSVTNIGLFELDPLVQPTRSVT